MKYQKIISFLILIAFTGCSSSQIATPNTWSKSGSVKAKFEPGDGECLIFIGQDLSAIGGLDAYKDGYCDYFDVPAGVTVYTGFATGSESYGYKQKGNDGIKTLANWGAGDNCAQCLLDDDDFEHSMVAIGLSLVGNEKKVANGQHDHLVRELGQWIKETERPVFLRIGYEFDGWDWNFYNKDEYLASWSRIHSIFEEMQISNVAFVWQSKGKGSGQDILEEWYPGDELVDWCSYSYFDNPDEEMLTFARRHDKPVFIAEATPIILEGTRFSNTFLTDPNQAEKAWKEWFVPFIKTLNENKDVIKAFSYINANWSVQPMWMNNPLFKHVDSRIQESDFVTLKWQEEISNPRYLKPSPEVWRLLQDER